MLRINGISTAKELLKAHFQADNLLSNDNGVCDAGNGNLRSGDNPAPYSAGIKAEDIPVDALLCTRNVNKLSKLIGVKGNNVQPQTAEDAKNSFLQKGMPENVFNKFFEVKKTSNGTFEVVAKAPYTGFTENTMYKAPSNKGGAATPVHYYTLTMENGSSVRIIVDKNSDNGCSLEAVEPDGKTHPMKMDYAGRLIITK